MRESVRKNQRKINDFKRYKETCQNTDEAQKYLKLHKGCPFGELEYGLALIHDNKVDEAVVVFEKLMDGKNRKYALTNLSCIELVQKEYTKCIEHLTELEKIDKEYYDLGNFKYIKCLCMNQLGIKPDISVDDMDYMESIIFNYDRKQVINHIDYHKMDVYVKKNRLVDFDEKKSDQRFFNDSIDIEKLYDEVMDVLKLDEVSSITEYAVSTKIFFRYDNIGRNTNGKQNYLAVMVLTGTNRIISMYPMPSPERDYLVDKKPVYDFQEILKIAREQKAL